MQNMIKFDYLGKKKITRGALLIDNAQWKTNKLKGSLLAHLLIEKKPFITCFRYLFDRDLH